jgi:hypothetical protein
MGLPAGFRANCSERQITKSTGDRAAVNIALTISQSLAISQPIDPPIGQMSDLFWPDQLA